MKEIAIKVNHLDIKYKSLKNFSIQGFFKSGAMAHKKDDVEAVKDVSFEVYKGEILGIIGKNGSGKSTLLRAIAGIFQPDAGTIDLLGHSVALMAVGVGFNNEITGRENIYASGLLMGFSRAYIEERIDEIIEFSELGEFIERPVRTYSSGMYSKLSFAVTSILDSDIILVDEVLSVGDTKFRKKSYAKMEELIMSKDRTVIIVSHSLDTLRGLCERVLWINEGKFEMIGSAEQVLNAYEDSIK